MRRSPIRSFLFVPGDQPAKMAKAMAGEADALILDLEDSVSPAAKPAARAAVRDFLAAARPGRPELWVRINPVSLPESLDDLAAIMHPALRGLVVPKIDGPADLQRVAAQLDALEVASGLTRCQVALMPVATETAPSFFRLGDYAGLTPRLYGLTWGAEDLSTALGASTNKAADGALALPYQMARAFCLAGARAAGVMPVETAPMEFRDPDAIAARATAARRDGFFGMMAIHPAQIGPINAAFSPAAAELAEAERIVAAFAAAGNPGVIALEGRMLDIPHLRQAQNLLALAAVLPPA